MFPKVCDGPIPLATNTHYIIVDRHLSCPTLRCWQRCYSSSLISRHLNRCFTALHLLSSKVHKACTCHGLPSSRTSVLALYRHNKLYHLTYQWYVLVIEAASPTQLPEQPRECSC